MPAWDRCSRCRSTRSAPGDCDRSAVIAGVAKTGLRGHRNTGAAHFSVSRHRDACLIPCRFDIGDSSRCSCHRSRRAHRALKLSSCTYIRPRFSKLRCRTPTVPTRERTPRLATIYPGRALPVSSPSTGRRPIADLVGRRPGDITRFQSEQERPHGHLLAAQRRQQRRPNG
jgi:hypothetical protein